MVKFKLWSEKILFWKTCIHYYKFDSFPIHEAFSNETGGDINECDFFMLICNILVFESLA